jgi:polysaccharide chain length determinant protein (PEP-CTERM system associated)
VQQDSAAMSGGFQFEDVVEILERRWRWLVIGGAAGLALGLLLYFVLPPVYTSSTTILVEPQEIPTEYIRSTITVDIEQRLDTLRERVTSFANLNDIIETIGVDRLDPSHALTREELIAKLAGQLEVKLGARVARESGANTFVIAYSGDDPKLVADVAREIAGRFISENIKDRARQAEATDEFLDRELARLRVDVAAQEEKIRAFKERRMGSLPGQLEANLRTLDRLNSELASGLEAQAAAQGRVAFLRRQLDVSATGQTPAGLALPGSLAGALQDARRRLLDAERIWTDEHPNVVRLREEVKRLEEEAAASAVEVPAQRGPVDPAIAALRQELATAELEASTRKQQEHRLREQIADLEKRVDEAPRLEAEQLTLTRDYENLTETYQNLLANKYQAALAKNLELAQKGERFKVTQPAQVPGLPSWPNIFILLGLGLGVGVAGAAGTVGIAEFRNPAFRSVARLTRSLGLPVVASIPRIDNDRIFENAPSGDVDPRLVVYTAPESAPAEQYRTFAPLFLEDESRRVVLVTSAARGDGKSLTTMNLALTIACDLNRRVLLIDGDLRRPTAHRLLRVRPKQGLSQVLRRQATVEECALNSKIPNLTLLPAGAPEKNPLALLTDKSFIELIAKAREQYDAVFIDSPPLLPVVDTRFLRRMADLVLFVVRADATPRDAVVRSLHDLRSVAGVVFNEVSEGSFRRYYYYDAYARYAYGEPTSSDEKPDSDA